MEYRPLGRTGVQVSKLCLGTMMFGACGNRDHADSIRIIHAALDGGVNFVVEVRLVRTSSWSDAIARYPLFGGQGRMNSWSPDSRRFAFVAYPATPGG